jgi:hypothetical protein
VRALPDPELTVRIEGQLKKCVLCDATLDVPDGAEPKSHIEGRSGEPNVRVLTVEGREIHRCEVHSS